MNQEEKNLSQEINDIFKIIEKKTYIELSKLNSKPYTKGITIYINKFIDKYCNLNSFTNKTIMRYINYLGIKFTNNYLNNNYKNISRNKYIVKKFILLIYLSIYNYHISILKQTVSDSSNKYFIIKRLYYLLKKISPITSKLYLDQIIDIKGLGMILKMLIIFSINDDYEKMKKYSDIKNFMYFKECLNIIFNTFNEKSKEDEKKFLVDIFKYVNDNICFRDRDNTNINYTNKFYLLHNDHKTTKLIKLLYSIYLINNKDLTRIYFDFLSNIYFFHFSYNNLIWQYH